MFGHGMHPAFGMLVSSFFLYTLLTIIDILFAHININTLFPWIVFFFYGALGNMHPGDVRL